MYEKIKEYSIVAFFILLFCTIIYGTGYVFGARGKQEQLEQSNREYQRELAEARELAEHRGAELAEFVGDAERRASSIRDGLGKSLELSIRAADRSKRIAILVEAIDRALDELDTSTRSGDRGEDKAR